MQVCTARDDNRNRGDLRGFENVEFVYVHKQASDPSVMLRFNYL